MIKYIPNNFGIKIENPPIRLLLPLSWWSVTGFLLGPYYSFNNKAEWT